MKNLELGETFTSGAFVFKTQNKFHRIGMFIYEGYEYAVSVNPKQRKMKLRKRRPGCEIFTAHKTFNI